MSKAKNRKKDSQVQKLDLETPVEVIDLDGPVERAVLEELPDNWTPEAFLSHLEETHNMEIGLKTILEQVLDKDEENVLIYRNDLFGGGVNSRDETARILSMTAEEVKMLEETATRKLRGWALHKKQKKEAARQGLRRT